MPLLALAALLILLTIGGATMTTDTFVRTIAKEARRHLDVLRPDLAPALRDRAAAIIAAQAALESGHGKTRAFREGWNFANISKGSWTGPTIPGGDKEYDAKGTVTTIRQEWRKYGSLAAAMSDLFTLLSWTRYRGARDALFAGDPDAYAARLREGGFYTAPLAEYQRGIRSNLIA